VNFERPPLRQGPHGDAKCSIRPDQQHDGDVVHRLSLLAEKDPHAKPEMAVATGLGITVS
jgi:hypothetical protein